MQSSKMQKSDRTKDNMMQSASKTQNIIDENGRNCDETSQTTQLKQNIGNNGKTDQNRSIGNTCLNPQQHHHKHTK